MSVKLPSYGDWQQGTLHLAELIKMARKYDWELDELIVWLRSQ